MAEDPNFKIALEAVLRDRDDLYRRLMQAERKLKEMSDLQAMKDSYEARLSEKDKIIEAKDKAIESKDNRIASLERKLEYLQRKVWGAMSEKRKLPDDPNQLKLDFDKMDMTPEEEEAARQAIKEVSEYKRIKVREHEKKVPVRQKLPEHLRREEEHIYPEGYLGHEDQWVLFNETETSEHLEYKPAE
ncbi:transposase, partial [Bacteroides caecigallinarum]|nr:IS66 family transposase [Bacteroides caecigallinarum]